MNDSPTKAISAGTAPVDAPAITTDNDSLNATRLQFEAAWRKKYGMPVEASFSPFKDGRYEAPAIDDAWVGFQLALDVGQQELQTLGSSIWAIFARARIAVINELHAKGYSDKDIADDFALTKHQVRVIRTGGTDSQQTAWHQASAEPTDSGASS